MHLALSLILVLGGLLADVPLDDLETTQIKIVNGQFALGDDGSIWAIEVREDTIAEGFAAREARGSPQHQRLVRFDQGEWKVIQADLDPNVSILVPGAKGIILLGGAPEWMLYQGAEKIASGSLFTLLEDHRDLIVQAFGPEHLPAPIPEKVMIVADLEGRIWCLYDNTLKALVGNHWIDALDPLTKAGSRNGALQYLAPVDEGHRVYVSDLGLRHDGGRSFFGRIEGGKLQFTDAPHVNSDLDLVLVLRDREGATWISEIESMANGPSDMIYGQIAVRVKDGNISQQLKNSGWACLADESNNVWLNNIRGKASNHVNIWHDGEIIQELQIPPFKEKIFLFSIGPGSVYVFTGKRLHHLTANPPDFRQFWLDQTYSNSDARTHSAAFSKQGWFITTTTINNKQVLKLVRLPERTAAEKESKNSSK